LDPVYLHSYNSFACVLPASRKGLMLCYSITVPVCCHSYLFTTSLEDSIKKQDRDPPIGQKNGMGNSSWHYYYNIIDERIITFSSKLDVETVLANLA
jgi:hypothetical protein